MLMFKISMEVYEMFCSKFRNIILVSFLFCLLNAAAVQASAFPDAFCYLDVVIPDAVYDMRYFGNNNFVGEKIDGYERPRFILTKVAAYALLKVQRDLSAFGLGLKFFDGYRPQMAVDHFVRWAEDLKDVRMKGQFYPEVAKENLFRDGYIAARSGHSRGSTVDLTLINLESGRELNMGTPFDFFSHLSWPESMKMPAQIRANRALLREVMVRYGFRPLKEEWWHFTLDNEPFPDTYFNFPIR